MYEKFYNLKKLPFHITPDLRFLFLSETHKQALASMIYVIQKREGFMAITGGVGVGKTTTIHAFLEKARSAGLKVIYVFHANMTFKDLIKTMYEELELEITTTDLIEMVNGLHVALRELHKQGKTVVLIIDEAQTMSIDSLANMRMLSNLETPTEKLIQVMLVGQIELDEMLEKNELRQLKQRIAIRSRIAPLSPLESYAYITHRLSIAGLDKPTIFSKGALDVIVKEAEGVPRVLNVLCNNALIAGFRRGKNPVTAGIAKEIVAEYTAKERRAPVRNWKAAALAGGVAALLALVLVFFLSPYRYDLVRRLPDFGLWQVTKPEPARASVSQPKPAEQLPIVPTPAAAPPSKPQRATEPTRLAGPKAAAIKPEKVIPPKYSAAPQPGGAEGSYTTRVVKPGDTLSGLISEVYGVTPKSAVQSPLIDLVKQYNPAIKDSNVIVAGSEIRFPELPKKK